MALLKHNGIHFSQLHPLSFMRIVQFELSCAAFAGEPSFSQFCQFSRLLSDGDWFMFAKRKDSMSLWSLLHADCKGVSFVVGGVANLKMGDVLEGVTADVGGTAGAVEGTPSVKEGSHEGSGESKSSPPVEDGSSRAPIGIPAAPASSRAKGKSPEVSVAPTDPVAEASPVQATGQSKFKLSECFCPRSPMAPLFAEGLPDAYIPRCRITPSTIVDTLKVTRNFMAHAHPHPHRFMKFALDPKIFDDQYSLSICEGFFKGAGMLQRVNALRDENEGLMSD
ncbi:hypothetical protein HanLR1_Chr00c0961g0785821 [Helianthus annuus]|nr:hypothetical protein HanLR1_Chr00c0961g0785821 [Helianthus annuus]